MQVKAEQLRHHLGESLLPIYLVSGEETLLVEEACDDIIRAAAAQGFTERSIHHVDGTFRWANLSHDAASLSLFAERKILDVRIPVKRFDRDGSAALREWVELAPAGPAADNVLLMRTGRLESRQRSSAWFKALDKIGAITLIWPLSVRQLPRWLNERARNAGIEIERTGLHFLAERVEGNLLAAAQAVEKLVLMDLPQPVTLEALAESIEDTSHYNSFDLLDAMMGADPAKVAKIISVLREEGVSLYATLGALTSQLRRIDGPARLPPARQKLVREFVQRIKDPGRVLYECAIIDQQGKGELTGDAWISLENLMLRLASLDAMPLPSQDKKLVGKHVTA